MIDKIYLSFKLHFLLIFSAQTYAPPLFYDKLAGKYKQFSG